MTKSKVHWAGGISAPGVIALKGWPCCCHGNKAQTIREKGQMTYFDLDIVTCKSCKRMIDKYMTR